MTRAEESKTETQSMYSYTTNLKMLTLILLILSRVDFCTANIFQPATTAELQNAINLCIEETLDGSCPTRSETVGSMSTWDVSQITDFSRLFEERRAFNQNLSSWNVSQATIMTRMFSNCFDYAYKNKTDEAWRKIISSAMLDQDQTMWQGCCRAKCTTMEECPVGMVTSLHDHCATNMCGNLNSSDVATCCQVPTVIPTEAKNTSRTKPPPCISIDGKKKNLGNCQCGTQLCDFYDKGGASKMIQPQGYCDVNRIVQKCYTDSGAPIQVRLKIYNNRTCDSVGALKLAKDDVRVFINLRNDIEHECKFSGQPCKVSVTSVATAASTGAITTTSSSSSSAATANDKSCVCGYTAACTPQLGLKCVLSSGNDENEEPASTGTDSSSLSTCSFAAPCEDQDGTKENAATCACGSTHCTPVNGLFCRNQERYGLEPLAQACSVKLPLPICDRRNGILPNREKCSCGFNICTPKVGLLCDSSKSTCTKSVGCSSQAIKAMRKQDTCAQFSPRCKCAECMENHYGRRLGLRSLFFFFSFFFFFFFFFLNFFF